MQPAPPMMTLALWMGVLMGCQQSSSCYN